MENPRKLKVLSYNIHKGFTVGNAAFVLGHIREAIRIIHPDIVFLQEVLGNHDKHRTRFNDWPAASQFEYLADEVWPHFAYGKNAVYQHGHHGNVIMSKYPFQVWENIDISLNRFERRGILHGAIPVPGMELPLHVFCLHLNLLKRGRRKQLEVLCQRIEEHVPDDCPIVIAGDFNDWREEATEVLAEGAGVNEAFVLGTGQHARTFPARLPMLPLDRIYVRGLRVENVKLLDGQPWNSLSDHLAIYCELVLPRG